MEQQAWGKPDPVAIVRNLMMAQAGAKIEQGDYRKFHNLKLVTSVSNTALVTAIGNIHAA